MNRLSLLSKHIGSTPSHEYTKLRISTESTVGRIHLSSPKDLNALSLTMQSQITSALKQLYDNQQIKVIVIQSENPKAFCAGANIKQFLNKDYEYLLKYELFNVIEDGFRNIKKPVIAAIDGIALGGGFQLALLCDIIVCSEKAKFALPEVNLGLMPGIGGTQRLAKVLGEKLTMKMVLTGDPITGQRAGELGLAQFVPSTKDFNQQVTSLAERIGSKALSALIVGKRAVKQSSDMTLTQGLNFEKATFYPLLHSKGAKEGVSAFVEKRKANFNGM